MSRAGNACGQSPSSTKRTANGDNRMNRQHAAPIAATAYDGTPVYLWLVIAWLPGKIQQIKCWAESKWEAGACAAWAYQVCTVTVEPYPVEDVSDFFGCDLVEGRKL